MQTTPSLPASADAEAVEARRLLSKSIWIPFAVALLAGMLVHSTVYLNGLVNPDGLWQGEYSLAGPWEVSLGRWGLYLVDILHAGVNSATMSAFFTVVFTALAGALVASLFQVKSMAKAIAIAALLTCSPMVAMFMTYPYCGDAYALSILLGVLAVYAVHAFPGTVKGGVLSALCIALMMGLYQSSLGVTLAVAAGYVLIRLLRSPRELKAIGRDVLYLVAATAVGLVLYYAIMHLALRIWGITLAEYKGAGNVGILSALQSIPSGIRDAYSFFKMFFLDESLARNPYFTTFIYCILAGVALVSLLVRLATAEDGRPYVPVFCLAILAVFPLCCNIINLLVPNTAFYLLMTGGMMMTALLLIAIADINRDTGGEKHNFTRLQNVLGKCAAVLAAMLIWVYVLSCQTDASVMQTNRYQIEALANSIWQQVETSEGYMPGETPVLIAGHPQEGNYPNLSQLAGKVNTYVYWGAVWSGYDGNINSWQQIYKQYLGIAYAGVTAEEFAAISASEAFAQMPLYPQAGSVQRIDDTLVVKVSDTAKWAY